MTTATAKPSNYTTEQVATLVQEYTAGVTVEALAAAMGKSVASVRAKLSREGVYKKKEYVGKTGEKPQKKDQTAEAIGAVLRLSEGEADSLTKANKTALAKVFAALASSKPIDGADDAEWGPKVETAEAIGELVGDMGAEDIKSLARANKPALDAVFRALMG